ncbi:hypothetical protein COLU111180_06925 [Cohnella lubricantis]|uniref:sugar-binding domain-containing protein n=1 Tax=Cohnella lubricantis TaxID=2163172 RepID=UPI0035DAAD2D|nr:DNA-binding transcriptional regulator LsrR (DeoR family) [Cohnella lubricantis]
MRPSSKRLNRTGTSATFWTWATHYIDSNGNIIAEHLNQRAIGIDLEELRRKDQSILVAGGAEKVAGIAGALRGKYANVLITDLFTAKYLLEQE